MVTHATASSMPCKPPPFSATAMQAPSTWREPASPRSCATSSNTCARPEAPIGCPFDSSPPDGLTGTRPPIVVSPRSLIAPPSQKSKAEVFDLYDFAHSSRVVYFGYRNISRPDPGLFIGTPRGERRTVFLHLGWFAIT